MTTRPLEGHHLFQEGLSFRVMALSSDRAGEGPVEMAEQTSECRSRIKPSDLLPKGSHTLTLVPAGMQQGTHTVQPQQDLLSPRSRNSEGHKPGLCSAATAAQPLHFGSPAAAAACPWGDGQHFGGGTALPTPSSCTPNLSRGGGGRVGAAG